MKTAAIVVSGVLLSIGAPDVLSQTSYIYRLSPGSSLDEIYCTGPCACPYHGVTSSLTGTFILTPTSQDPLFTNYSIRAVEWDPSNPSTGHITGAGTYRRGGEVAVQQQMTLRLEITGQTWTLDSGLVAQDPNHPFPAIGLHLQSPIVGCRQDTLDLIAEPFTCYANCDASTGSPVLNVADFTCFLQRYAAGDAYANCDGSTAAPALNIADFTCYLQSYAAGCL
jgi:hypothetical protein